MHMHNVTFTAGRLRTRRQCRMAASPPKAKRVKYSSVGGAAKYGTKYKQQWEEETRMFHAVRSASAAFFVGCAAKMLAATIKGRQM